MHLHPVLPVTPAKGIGRDRLKQLKVKTDAVLAHCNKQSSESFNYMYMKFSSQLGPILTILIQVQGKLRKHIFNTAKACNQNNSKGA